MDVRGRSAREYQVWWMTAGAPSMGATFDTIGEALRYARFRERHPVFAIRKPDGGYFLGSQDDLVAVYDLPAVDELSAPR